MTFIHVLNIHQLYHFADDTNLLNISYNYKTLTKEINKDLNVLLCGLQLIKFR